MSQTVVGIFDNADEAQRAVNELRNNGFDDNNVDYATGYGDYATEENRHEHETGIARFFRNLFGDDDESDRYSRVAKNGCVVTVHAQSTEEARRASEILDEYGAVDVDEKDREYTARSSAYGTKDTDYTGTNPNATDETYFENTDRETRKIPIVEEDIKVGKKVVEKGGVRVHSRIVEKPVEKTIRLREEYVHVERNKVDRPASDAELNDFEEGTIEVREHAEVPVVTKDTKVVEEVGVNKTVEEHEQTVRDTVRKTDVDVEEYGTGKKRND